jgi:hypothetical protein
VIAYDVLEVFSVTLKGIPLLYIQKSDLEHSARISNSSSLSYTPYKCGVATFLGAVEIHFDDVVIVKILDMIPLGLHTVAAMSNTNFLWAM